MAKRGNVERRISFRPAAEEPDHRQRLLRMGGQRAPGHRAAQQCHELPPPHSITSSARASSVEETVRPSVLAVFRLMASSNLVGACTGRSAGLAPLRMRSTYEAERRKISEGSGP